MAEILRLVDRTIPPNQRYLHIVHSGINAGDIILAKDSLGKLVSHLTINASGGAMEVKLNVKRTIFPNHIATDSQVQMIDHLPHLASGVSYIETSMSTIPIANNESLIIDDEIAISDIQIVTAAGAWDILLM